MALLTHCDYCKVPFCKFCKGETDGVCKCKHLDTCIYNKDKEIKEKK